MTQDRKNDRRANLNWLDCHGVRQHIIGRLIQAQGDRIRVLVAMRLEPPLTMRYWTLHGERRGEAQLVGSVNKAGGFLLELQLFAGAGTKISP